MSVRIAIVGAGKMGHIHAEAYERLAGVEVTHIVEKDPVKGRAFSQQYGCLLVDTIETIGHDEVDAVDICLPTWLHTEAIADAVKICRFGVLCEKPICLRRDEFEVICETVKNNKCFVMVGQVLRFWSGYTKIWEMIREGAIGTPHFITCQRRQKMPDWSMGNWLMDEKRSGGILMDLNIHDVDYIYWLLGRPATVACEIVAPQGKTLHSLITLTYPECCVSIVGSWGMPAAFCNGNLGFCLEVVGDRGMLVYEGEDVVHLTTDVGNKSIALVQRDAYEQELEYFVDCIRQRKQPAKSNIDAVKGTMEILWAAEQARKCREIVSFGNQQSGC